MNNEKNKKKIVLIGDSIRKGYDSYTKMAFEDVAEVYYPNDNCRFASYILRHLIDWKEQFECGDDVDCVHWNAGLWDDLVMIDGEHHTPIEIYRYYIERVCKLIKKLFPYAKVIFATSTPVQEELFWRHKRYNRDTEKYNDAAVEIARKHGFEINDLYAITKDAPVEYHSDATHYYTKEGTRLITNKVVECIENCLGIKAKELDYDKLFAETDDIVGM